MKTALSSVPKFVNRNKSLILKVTPDIVQYLSKIFSNMLMEAIGDSETRLFDPSAPPAAARSPSPGRQKGKKGRGKNDKGKGKREKGKSKKGRT